MENFDYVADVSIVGAGPAGALLAYLLASHNISTILIERHGDINKEFRGEHLNETGEEILRKYGLFDELEKIGLLRMDRIEYWDQGKVFKMITPNNPTNHLGIHVPQKHLLGMLLKKSSILPAYSILFNTNVTGLIEENDRYTGLTAMMNGQEISIKSKLIVGADGRFSTIRKLANISVEKIKHGYDLLWARIPAPPDWEPIIRMSMINDEQLALFTQQGGFVQIGWNIPEGSFSELKKQSFVPFVKQLIDAVPELEQSVHKHIKSWNDFVLLQVQSSRCETWVKSGLAIIGDAAHTMSPTGAIGINSAMKDSDVLFELIHEAVMLNKLESIDLSLFEEKRRQEVEDQQKFQLEKESSYGKQFIPV